MEQTITIHITQEHIDNGQPEYANKCAIALALKEQLGWPFPMVEPEWCYGDGNEFAGFDRTKSYTVHPSARKYPHYLLSDIAREFVVDSQNGKEVKPAIFQFELYDIPLYIMTQTEQDSLDRGEFVEVAIESDVELR